MILSHFLFISTMISINLCFEFVASAISIIKEILNATSTSDIVSKTAPIKSFLVGGREGNGELVRVLRILFFTLSLILCEYIFLDGRSRIFNVILGLFSLIICNAISKTGVFYMPLKIAILPIYTLVIFFSKFLRKQKKRD